VYLRVDVVHMFKGGCLHLAFQPRCAPTTLPRPATCRSRCPASRPVERVNAPAVPAWVLTVDLQPRFPGVRARAVCASRHELLAVRLHRVPRVRFAFGSGPNRSLVALRGRRSGCLRGMKNAEPSALARSDNRAHTEQTAEGRYGGRLTPKKTSQMRQNN